MGTFIVAFPIVLREVYDGTSADGIIKRGKFRRFGANHLVLLRLGQIQRAGRALLLAQFIGSIVLLCSGLVKSLFIFFVFLWGVCGGGLCPCRAPSCSKRRPRARGASHELRILLGAGPLGALWAGYGRRLQASIGIAISAGAWLCWWW